MRLLSIVGARPQFIKLAALARAIQAHNRSTTPTIQHLVIHTGQHYDPSLSQVFFEQLNIPPPMQNLGVGSGPPGWQTAQMLQRLEPALQALRPDRVVIFGDTNSTLAGALAAAKCHLPLAHVEAGLRSFDRRMPEELNRVVADALSDLLFCPSRTAVQNLAAEGIRRGVHLVGDVMYEVTKTAAGAAARRRAELLDRLGLAERQYYLATVHRAENTDQPRRLEAIFSALSRCERCVVVPLHPRTRQRLGNGQLAATGRLKLIEPLGYPDMVALIGSARIVLTDSGGLQKESYWLGVPCITLRERTEWPELVEAGCNRLTGADPTAIASALAHFESQEARLPADLPPELYGDGQAARRIVEVLANSGS